MNPINYRDLYPELNWQEADEVGADDLVAAGDFFDRLVKARKEDQPDGLLHHNP